MSKRRLAVDKLARCAVRGCLADCLAYCLGCLGCFGAFCWGALSAASSSFSGSESASTALRSRRCSLRWCEFQRFLMALSVRPGKSLTISDHLVPRRATASTMMRSSSSLQGAFWSSGLRWLCHRSRHCLPKRALPSWLAMKDHREAPCWSTSWRRRSSSDGVHGCFFECLRSSCCSPVVAGDVSTVGSPGLPSFEAQGVASGAGVCAKSGGGLGGAGPASMGVTSSSLRGVVMGGLASSAISSLLGAMMRKPRAAAVSCGVAMGGELVRRE
mmetsp:Transcript_10309/g.24727  ORF Transcript_10309/g.24727 Transcript_10309/m.24727 type:complete len:272 (-) Transcript_10309:99-914(-)